jgi:hypothetical protein
MPREGESTDARRGPRRNPQVETLEELKVRGKRAIQKHFARLEAEERARAKGAQDHDDRLDDRRQHRKLDLPPSPPPLPDPPAGDEETDPAQARQDAALRALYGDPSSPSS